MNAYNIIQAVALMLKLQVYEDQLDKPLWHLDWYNLMLL